MPVVTNLTPIRPATRTSGQRPAPRRIRVLGSALALAVTLTGACLLDAGQASAAAPGAPDGATHTEVSTVATFDHAAGQTPENLVVTRSAVFVSLAFASTVVVLTPHGATLQSVTLPTGGGFIAGLALDPARRALAVAVSSPQSTISGIWELPLGDRRGADPLGTPKRLAALPANAFPNGLVVTPAGDLFAADSLLETIWRVPARSASGLSAQAWLQDPLLAPSIPGLPGANGLKYRQGRLYISNTGRNTLLTVPLSSPAALTVVRDDLRIDDFTFGCDGTLYAALNADGEVVATRAHAGASVTVLADTANGVHNPTAVALGSSGCDDGLYVTNAAFDGPTPPPSLQLITDVFSR